ncbi:kinase-like domain-containing protein [Thelephora terrestris]|uniref:Kinase-like domain-containing protein n=1 Tax=Thelephora terrestris TaxID=56493 RepID=A0A9P6HNR9_9AGAM|nr:kinase-like domain-containing protein [Thelephora terrestris]
MYSGGDPHKVKEAFRKVAVISKRSAHPNIVPLLGVTLEPLELISEWMSGGDLPRYISKHPGADILSLLSDVAEGLSYLHSCNVIHGDLKGSNILVDQYDRARITDFGLSMVTQDLGSMRSIWIEDNQSVRWIAPEILGGGTYSKETDIFSLAGVTIEAFTGAAPFSDKPPHEALSAVERGERPPRPAHPTLTNEIWKLIEQCWDGEASLRPHALIVSCGFKGVPVWKRLTDLTLTMDERISLIMYYNNTEVSRRLPQDDAQSLVDEIDKLLNTLAPQHRRGCLGALRTICGQQALLPKSLQIQLPEDWPIEPHCNGGYADVWKVEYRGSMVAVKILKVSQTSDLGKIKRNFFKEVILWKTLHHPNVLPLLGAIMNERRFGMVSKWMVNESIGEFVKNHKNENRFELLKGVTIGLMYLHKQEVIHGDLKGANILIDQNRVARLADFGLLTFARDPANPTTSTTSIRGTARWMSPELLYPERFGFKDSWPTEESDRYALGMVILEVLSGQVPFVDDWDIVVIRKVTDGERPKRPDVAWLTNNVWGMLSHCWAPRPPDRPMLQDVLRCLAEASLSWATLSHPISSTLDTYEGELPDQEETLSMDEPAIHGANFGPEHTYVQTFMRLRFQL